MNYFEIFDKHGNLMGVVKACSASEAKHQAFENQIVSKKHFGKVVKMKEVA